MIPARTPVPSRDRQTPQTAPVTLLAPDDSKCCHQCPGLDLAAVFQLQVPSALCFSCSLVCCPFLAWARSVIGKAHVLDIKEMWESVEPCENIRWMKFSKLRCWSVWPSEMGKVEADKKKKKWFLLHLMFWIYLLNLHCVPGTMLNVLQAVSSQLS